MFDIVKIMLQPTDQLIFRIGFPAPAIDLRPTRSARFDIMARGISPHNLAKEAAARAR